MVFSIFLESVSPPAKMDKELQKLIDERQELIDKLCMEIVAVEEGMIKIPVEAK